jgi:hypothetical protein
MDAVRPLSNAQEAIVEENKENDKDLSSNRQEKKHDQTK